MVVIITYNPEGIGDVLINTIKDRNKEEVSTETFGTITKIINNDKNILGYNIFNASSYFQLNETGQFHLTEELLSEMKQLFMDNQLNDNLDFDLSPKFV